MNTRPPEWAFEFHGHLCPFMPLGYRMGKRAMEELGVEHEKDHGFFVIPELGIGHPQTCLMDGIQVATGATYGKSLMEKTFWGKLAAVFYHPEKGAIRLSLKADFVDEFGKQEFFAYRKRGVEPSGIPADITDKAMGWTDAQPDEKVFKIEKLPEYRFKRVKGSFNKSKCVKCGEYVFERYVRMANGEPHCIPCSGYDR
ncbi:MAG: FmdE family protein [Dehalococcoidia bacterium]|nr:FmdE family protein [Dehalococcoidia bacterium]